jgi:thiol:disulfide interchange protein
MQKNLRLLFILFFFGWLTAPFSHSASIQEGPVSIHLESTVHTIPKDQPFWIAVKFSVKPGWHLYGPEPGEAGIPLTLDWSLPRDVKVLDTIWPEPHTINQASVKSYIYESEFSVLVKMEASSLIPEGKIDLSLRWLACHDICSPGKENLSLHFPFKDKLLPLSEVVQSQQKADQHISDILDYSWVLAVLFAFVGGIILNFMPCVLPVLSLKLFDMIKHKDLNRTELIKNGLAYTGGVLSSFLIISVTLLLLRDQGQELGWGFQLQSPIFIAFLCGLFFLLALNLWGVFEIGTSLVRLQSLENHKNSYVSSFLNGILACVVASPCTSPFMGTALGIAIAQNWFVSMLIFAALGFGMASPFLMVCLFPKTLKLLPKPGPWMDTFKKALGFALMATVVWLCWIFGHQTGVNPLIKLLIALLLVAIGAWIKGNWAAFHKPHPTRLIANIVSFSIIILAGTVAFESTRIGITTNLKWEVYSPEKFEELRAKGKPVLIDFTAAWCLTCQVNKKMALESESVIKKVKELGITPMRADWTNQDPVITQVLAGYGRNSIPLYVLHYGPNQFSKPIILPQFLTPQIIVNELEKVKK